MNRNKYIKKSLFILTEGETEEAYFTRLGEILGDDDEWKYSVTVDVREIRDGSKTDPVHIVKEAKESKKTYDEVWVVFDKDRERDDENFKAIDLAKKWKIEVLFSSISFEEWVLLHFERSTKAFERSDCESRGETCICNGTICTKTYIKQNYYSAYEKGKKVKAKLYDDLRDKQNIALENAAWLRLQHSPITNYYLLNPYTNVDIFVAQLLGLPAIRYVKVNSIFDFDGIDFCVTNHSMTNDVITVSLLVKNNSIKTFVFNTLQNVYLIGANNEEFAYNISETQVINQGESKEVNLQFTINLQFQVPKLKFQAVNELVYVEL